jgi:hypothetical protein
VTGRISHGDAFWLTLLGLVGALVFSLDATALSLTPLTLIAVSVLATAHLRRPIADAHRRFAERALGTPVPSPYRRCDDESMLRRVVTVVRDPATWRDLLFLLVNSIVGVFVATLSISLLLGGLLYLIFPFLWWVTPGVFDTNFGLFQVHDLASSWAVLPLGALGIALWWFGGHRLLIVNARLARALLSPTRHAATTSSSHTMSEPQHMVSPAAGPAVQPEPSR